MKKKITNGDLLELVREKLLTFDDCPKGVAMAIVPHETQGWAILSKRNTLHPLCARRIELIEKQLRGIYDLASGA